MNEQTTEQPPVDGGDVSRPAFSHRRSTFSAWLQLLRAPNLLTVPGDAVMGFLLALSAAAALAPTTGWERPHMLWLRLALAACVSLLLYCAGVIWNDLFDLAEDRRDRPHRPLPAGEIRPVMAALVANVLAAMSVAVAAVIGEPALYVTLVLGLLVLAYNARAKRSALLGPVTMGLCRGLSVLVGAAALARWEVILLPSVWAPAAMAAVYVAAVTYLARGETRRRPVTLQSVFIFLAAIGWVMVLVVTAQPFSSGARWAVMVMGCLAVFWVSWRLGSLKGSAPAPAAVQQTVGGLVRGLILFQAMAVIAIGWPGLYAAGALILCFLISAPLAKRFYGS